MLLFNIKYSLCRNWYLTGKCMVRQVDNQLSRIAHGIINVAACVFVDNSFRCHKSMNFEHIFTGISFNKTGACV